MTAEPDHAPAAALEAALGEAAASEVPAAAVALRVARAQLRAGDLAAAKRWALAVVDGGDDVTAWQGAARVLEQCADAAPAPRRRVKIAVVGSFTTSQLVVALRLAAARFGVEAEIYEGGFGQYRQEILDRSSGLHRFAPDVVVIAAHAGELGLPFHGDDPEAEVARELRRWTSLWDALTRALPARVVQLGFAVPDLAPLGNLAARLPGARETMTRELNLRLGAAAGGAVSMVDCERLSALYGKERWFDPRYWHLSKQAVALGAVPLLARHLAAVIAADLGLSRKCIVLDLDNTLWGGVIGEDGIGGIRWGGGPEGEAFVAFQEYVLELKARGVVLAVCSKNNPEDAMEPFERHPEMRLKVDDIAVFVASWETKPDQLRQIAKILDLGVDSLVFVDDNPVEREAMRLLCPEVEVVALPSDPALYPRALSQHLSLEPSTFTPDDARRTDQYRARAAAAELEASASSIEELLDSLEMRAVVTPIGELDLDRVVQLIGKTNQFNLTSRRHGRAQVERLIAAPGAVHLTLRLVDRFADHGLVSVLIASRDDDVLDIDTWLMSCRVIGRTVEDEMLRQLCERASAEGVALLRGTYIPTAKNVLVADVFDRFGFTLVDEADGQTTWEYDLRAKEPIESRYIDAGGSG